MNLAPFEERLKRAIGLDAASIGTTAIERAVRERMNAVHLPEAAYLQRLDASELEVQALVEAIVVPETWFFRDPEAFALLVRQAHEEWLRGRAEAALRILSVPCSTGEEPYSIAMALLDAGVAPDRFHIDAIDVSEVALARAQQAVYGRNSFRGSALGFRDRYFAGEDGRWTLAAAVRRQVSWQRANLLDPLFGASVAPYDAIFCRNLLIYFDRPTQDRAVAALGRLLKPTGTFFVGPSETALLLSHAFEAVRAPLAFAFRPAAPRVAAAVAPVRSRPLTPPPPVRSRGTAAIARAAARPSEVKPSVSRPPPMAKPAPAATATDPLETAAQLAGQGHLVEAGRLCEEQLRVQGPSARAFYLLGVVRDATGNHAEAAELYRKTLYLAPTHYDALMHLAYLTEAAGDLAGARVLTARAQRVAEQARK